MPCTTDDIAWLLQKIAAAPTRTEAIAIFENADWIFIDMHPRGRDALYGKIQDIIGEKPE
jgi:hypothetical protein